MFTLCPLCPASAQPDSSLLVCALEGLPLRALDKLPVPNWQGLVFDTLKNLWGYMHFCLTKTGTLLWQGLWDRHSWLVIG